MQCNTFFPDVSRSDPQNPNEAILVWGDTGGAVNALHFTSANIALFERPSAPAGEKQGIFYAVIQAEYRTTLMKTII